MFNELDPMSQKTHQLWQAVVLTRRYTTVLNRDIRKKTILTV